jgi:hypothetical protein
MPLSYTFWNRLEPSPRTANPDRQGVARALAAEVHDPLWFLTRQWQLGELRGEDAASPAWIELGIESAVDATWRASREGAPSVSLLTPPLSLPGMPLERALLEEPGDGGDLSLSVELSQTFEALLRERSRAASDAVLLRQLRTHFPLRAPEGDDDARRFVRVCARRAWDGVEFVRAAGGDLWRELRVTLEAGQAAALAAFQAHVRAVHGSLQAAPPQAWVAERLDYDASVGLHSPDAEVARLRVRPGSDGTTDWYSADATHTGGFAVGRTRVFIPGNVRFRGMPNARFWDFESSRSDLGDLTVDLRDLGRLAVMDFMLVHGNDWFVVPLLMHVGTACRIARLRVHDVFGEVTDVRRAEHYSRGWSMFSTSVAEGDVADFFHLPATSSFTAQQGPALEEVRFLRDEGANLAWAVEASVCDAVGVPRTARERDDALRRARDAVAIASAPRGDGAPPVAQYTLQTDVPAYWYPLVPERGSDGAVWLRLGTFVTSAQVATPPDGRLLRVGAALRVRSDAVPEAGVRVVRRRMVSRWIDGSLHVWTQRVVLPGVSEGSSGLRYDALTWRR